MLGMVNLSLKIQDPRHFSQKSREHWVCSSQSNPGPGLGRSTGYVKEGFSPRVCSNALPCFCFHRASPVRMEVSVSALCPVCGRMFPSVQLSFINTGSRETWRVGV